MNWVRKTLANVAGTQEPIYGPGAIQSVATQTENTPYTALTRDDLRWRAMGSSCVETQTFYLDSDNGDVAILQVIYSNVNGIHTTCQFNSKVFSRDPDVPHTWHTDPVDEYMFDEDMLSFGGDNIALTLNEDGTSYSVKAAIHEDTLVNITATRLTPGFCVGKDGTSLFGTDPENPWGCMRHTFWPRCEVEGTIATKEREIDFKGRGFFVHALQGMKPHHAASKWNFVNCQTPTYSAIMMEFTTPPSYGSTVVAVGGIAKDGEILCAGTSLSATHVESTHDSEIDWPEPKAIRFSWDGKTKDGKDVSAVVEGPLGARLDRVDVMAEVPGIVKAIAGSVAGTRPYIYQFSPRPKLSLKLRIGDAEIVEEGTLFTEATFIS